MSAPAFSIELVHALAARANATAQEWLQHGDPRVRDWPLMRVDHMLLTVLAYLVIIPLIRFAMLFRSKPFAVRSLATLHNLNLTALSFYMMVEVLRQAFIKNNYSLFGNGVDRSDAGYGMARILYIFYLSKILEFIDTVIMALKKNDRQISFLHVYHHSSIFIIWWIIVYYAPGGEAYFSAALNSFIHVLMYGYYLWATFAPKLAEGRRPTFTHPAFYKRYITSLQMTQFTCMLVQSVYDLAVPNAYPRWCVWILFFYMFTMLGLFANFFIKNYVKPVKASKKKDL